MKFWIQTTVVGKNIRGKLSIFQKVCGPILLSVWRGAICILIWFLYRITGNADLLSKQPPWYISAAKLGGISRLNCHWTASGRKLSVASVLWQETYLRSVVVCGERMGVLAASYTNTMRHLSNCFKTIAAVMAVYCFMWLWVLFYAKIFIVSCGDAYHIMRWCLLFHARVFIISCEDVYCFMRGCLLFHARVFSVC